MRKGRLSKQLADIKANTLNNKGVAMLMVLIVSAVVMVFCLSLLLVTYSLFSQSARQTGRLQSKLYAQSCEESIKAELKNPDSDLNQYLKTQIQNGMWIPEGAGEEELANVPEEAVQEMILWLDTKGKAEGYQVKVVLTYSRNTSDDEDEGNEDDDQDEDLLNSQEPAQNPQSGQNGTKTQETGNSEPAGGNNEASVISYSIHAVIRCTKGEEADRDAQYYEMETTYSSVTL